MKRYASLDIVRGLCIIGMVSLHAFRRIYDASWVGTEDLGGNSLLHILFLLGLAYAGGMAGLFLMVSTISHTISLRNNLRKGKDINSLIMRQLAGGFLLLLFAFIVESTLGQHGFLGTMAYVDPFSTPDYWNVLDENSARILYRGFHFMTLHTIAWSVIVNSIIQWFLFRKGGADRNGRNVAVYVFLAVAVILLTPVMWSLADMVIPGYPFATYPGTDRLVQYPLEGVSGLPDYMKLFILGPLAGQTEPLFPFLFISFIGAVFGIYLSTEHPPRYLPHKGMKFGGAMFLIGVLGLGLMWYSGLDSFQNLVDHTYEILRLPIWLPLLFLTTGGQIVFLMMFLRIVEYRGVAASIVSRTAMIRRFSVVSLTVFTFQYMDAIPTYLLSLIPGINVYSGKEELFWSVIAVLLIILTWHLILKLWERADFRGSAEWVMMLVRNGLPVLFSGVRSCRGNWFDASVLGRLSRNEDIEWIDLTPEKLRGPDRERDSRLALWISALSLVIFPLVPLALYLARRAREREGSNRFNDLSLRLSRLGIGLGALIAFSLSQTKAYLLI
ncbi:MAG TPA: hypothetical protein ENK47_04390 [Euryarchaeota archaeon]|nr:hypothetical protein [Euryarchaeota archaeon]